MCTENGASRICRSKGFLQLVFSSFFCMARFDGSIVASPSEKRSKVSIRSKVGELDGTKKGVCR